jgi:hypothetical protein
MRGAHLARPCVSGGGDGRGASLTLRLRVLRFGVPHSLPRRLAGALPAAAVAEGVPKPPLLAAGGDAGREECAPAACACSECSSMAGGSSKEEAERENESAAGA